MKISDNFAINVLMRREAILAVKQRLYNEGRKVSLVRCAEIHALARQYLSEHEAELIVQAKAKWSAINDSKTELAWLLAKHYGARRARQLVTVQNSQITHRSEAG